MGGMSPNMLMAGGSTPWEDSQKPAEGEALRQHILTGQGANPWKPADTPGRDTTYDSPYFQAQDIRQKFLDHPMNQEALANPNSSPALIKALTDLGGKVPPRPMAPAASPLQTAIASAGQAPAMAPTATDPGSVAQGPSQVRPAPPHVAEPPPTGAQVNRSLRAYRAQASTQPGMPAISPPNASPGQPVGQQARMQGPMSTDFGNTVYHSKRGFGYNHAQAMSEALSGEQDHALANEKLLLAKEQTRLAMENGKVPLEKKLMLQGMQVGMLRPDAYRFATEKLPQGGTGIPDPSVAPNPGAPPMPDPSRAPNMGAAALAMPGAPAGGGLPPGSLFEPNAKGETLPLNDLVGKLGQFAVPGYDDPSSPVGQAVLSKMRTMYDPEELSAKNPQFVDGPGRGAWPIARKAFNAAASPYRFATTGTLPFSPFSDPIAESDKMFAASSLIARLRGDKAPAPSNVTGIYDPMTLSMSRPSPSKPTGPVPVSSSGDSMSAFNPVQTLIDAIMGAGRRKPKSHGNTAKR
jgi:hypothetical protein